MTEESINKTAVIAPKQANMKFWIQQLQLKTDQSIYKKLIEL